MSPIASASATARAARSAFRALGNSGADEKAAFREHVLSSVWSGVALGVLLLADVILAKTLHAPSWQVTLFATLQSAALLVSLFWTAQVHGRPKASYILLASLFGRVPLMFMPFAPGAWTLVTAHFLFSVANGLLITAANAIYQTRYREETRALRFALATSIGTTVGIVAARVAGYVLARHEDLYPWLFAASGVAGLVSGFHLYRMEAGRRGAAAWLRAGADSLRDRFAVPAEGARRPEGIRESLALARRIFRENPEFGRFERNFMIYGVAFMVVLPVLPLYVVHGLHMDYGQLSSAKGIWSQLGVVVLSPLLAVALAQLQPLAFTGRSFLVLAAYPALLLVSTFFTTSPLGPRWVYGALLVYSIAMAGVNLSWSLGSMHFAGRDDASTYQGIHVAMTGLRGALAPTLGWIIYSALGARAVFAVSALLFTTAGILMLKQHREIRDRAPGAAAAAASLPASDAARGTAVLCL